MYQTYQAIMTIKSFMIFIITISTAKGFQKNQNDFKSLLNKLQLEKDFENLIIIGNDHHHQYCIDENVIKSLNLPILLLKSTNKRLAAAAPIGRAEFKTETLNNEILVIYCIDDVQRFEVNHINVLLSFLAYKRSARIVFYWNNIYSDTSQQQKLKELFLYCKREYLLNVISVFKDFTTTMNFYTFTQFPQFNLQVKHLQKDQCFPNRLTNLNGAVIRTMPDQMQPHNVIYRDKNGQVQLIGYCARIVRAFAAKHNATLVFPFPLNLEMSYLPYGIFNMTINGMLDIPMSMWSPVTRPIPHEFSSIVEHEMIRFLLPLPLPLTLQEIFLLILISLFSLIVVMSLLILSAVLTFEHICWQDQVDDQNYERFFSIFSHTSIAITLPGILGKSIQLPKLAFFSMFKKCTYICLFILGIIVSTIYTAYLQSYFTSTLYGKRIQSYEELLSSPIRICVHTSLYKSQSNYADPRLWQKYKKVAYVTSNISEYRFNRHTLNPRYGYLGGNLAMSVMLKQQHRLFERPLFYSPEKMYLIREFYLAIPLHPHSIYRSALNTMILQLLESGLLDFWESVAYEDFRIAGFLNSRVIQREETEKCLKALDFYWVWWMYGIGMMFGIIMFILENIYFMRSRS